MYYLKTTPWYIRMFQPKGLIWDIKTTAKEIYLTFDDGPIPEITPWVIDLLKTYNIKATFFCVGENVEKYPDIFNLLIENEHAIGNHTYHHVNLNAIAPEIYLEEVRKCDDLVKSTLFRPPHGNISKLTAKILRQTYNIVMWSVIAADFDKKISKEKCLHIATKNIYPGCIITFHDSLKAQENMQYALPRFIAFALKEGYTFKKLPETLL